MTVGPAPRSARRGCDSRSAVRADPAGRPGPVHGLGLWSELLAASALAGTRTTGRDATRSRSTVGSNTVTSASAADSRLEVATSAARADRPRGQPTHAVAAATAPTSSADRAPDHPSGRADRRRGSRCPSPPDAAHAATMVRIAGHRARTQPGQRAHLGSQRPGAAHREQPGGDPGDQRDRQHRVRGGMRVSRSGHRGEERQRRQRTDLGSAERHRRPDPNGEARPGRVRQRSQHGVRQQQHVEHEQQQPAGAVRPDGDREVVRGVAPDHEHRRRGGARRGPTSTRAAPTPASMATRQTSGIRSRADCSSSAPLSTPSPPTTAAMQQAGGRGDHHVRPRGRRRCRRPRAVPSRRRNRRRATR